MVDSDELVDLAEIRYYVSKPSFTIADMVSSYSTLVAAGIMHLQSVTINQPTQFVHHVLLKGIDMISSVFSMTLLYTNNLQVACNQCQNAIIFYGEFVSQINHEKYNYIQLSVRDATLFVYKKTIYRINPVIKQHFTISTEDEKIHDILEATISTTTSIMRFVLREAYNIPTPTNDVGQPCISDIVEGMEQVNKRLVIICQTTENRDIILDSVRTTSQLTDFLAARCLHGKLLTESISKFTALLKSKISRQANVLSFLNNTKDKLVSSDMKDVSLYSSSDEVISRLTMSNSQANANKLLKNK